MGQLGWKIQVMRKTIFILLTLTLSVTVMAQSSTQGSTYRTALGVKVWDGGGITFKHFLEETNAVEFIGYFWNNGFRFTGLYEIHGAISGAPGLMWYVGPGAHIGFYDYYHRDHHIDGTYIGVDGVLGLDYKFNGAPINISLDWQPSFEFGHFLGFAGDRGGLGIRYTF